MWLLYLVLLTVIFLKFIYPVIKKSKKAEKTRAKESKDYTHSYSRKYLLTQNEYHAYKSLTNILDKYDLIVCPKVRLLDIIEPINGENYKGALAKIQSKHIDFLICDKNLFIKGIIELDDNTHNQPDRIERDKFVDAALRNVGYKVVHVRAITEETIKELLPKIE